MSLLTQSNLSADERERIAYIQGRPMLAALFDDAGDGDAWAESAGDAKAYIAEARGAFVDEDTLSGQITALRELARRLRGDNREDLWRIAQELETWRDEQALAGEYASEQMDKARDALEG